MGSYTLADQALGGGAYSLAINQFSVSVPNVLTASAGKIALTYDPAVTTSQNLLSVGSATATINPLNNASVAISNLVVRTDGFTLGSGVVSAGGFSLGGILSVS